MLADNTENRPLVFHSVQHREPSLRVQVWMYDFIFHEMNGIGLTIDRLETCTFYGDKVLPMVIPGKELSLYGLTDSISPLGEWKETGGLPVSDNVRGAGITLYCTDDIGEAVTFSNYVALNSNH